MYIQNVYPYERNITTLQKQKRSDRKCKSAVNLQNVFAVSLSMEIFLARLGAELCIHTAKLAQSRTHNKTKAVFMIKKRTQNCI